MRRYYISLGSLVKNFTLVQDSVISFVLLLYLHHKMECRFYISFKYYYQIVYINKQDTPKHKKGWHAAKTILPSVSTWSELFQKSNSLPETCQRVVPDTALLVNAVVSAGECSALLHLPHSSLMSLWNFSILKEHDWVCHIQVD